MFEDSLEKAKSEHGVGGGGEIFKFKEGKNRIRILAGGSQDEILATHWIANKSYTCYGKDNGCPYHGDDAPVDKDGKIVKPAVKYAFYVVNQAPKGKVQLAFLSYSIVKTLQSLSREEDWEFTELPMPYDIGVTYDPNAKAKADTYKVVPLPARPEFELTQETLDELAKVKPLHQIVQKIKDKAKGGDLGNETPEEKEQVDGVIEEIPHIDTEGEIKPEDLPF